MYHEAVYMIVTPAVSRGFLSQEKSTVQLPQVCLVP